MNRLFAPFTWFYRQLSRACAAAVGEVSWRPPGWVGGTVRYSRQHPGRATLWGLLLVAVIAAACGGHYWYLHRPKPQLVTWTVTLYPPGAPSHDFEVRTLTVHFDTPVAQLEKIGKDVTSHVTLTPPMKGKWNWWNDSQLAFTPEEDWKAGTVYHVKLSRELFSWHARLQTLEQEFRTTPFTVGISDAMFYVNPTDPKVKQVTATLTFSYPVDRASLEKSLTLAMQSGANVFKDAPNPTGRCTVTYDYRDRVAYVRSVNVELPAQESGHAILKVPAAVATIDGETSLNEEQRADVVIPTRLSLFHLADARPIIVTNTEDDPEQALVLTSSIGVKPELMAKAVHAWLLPDPKPVKDPNTDSTEASWRSAAEITPEVLARAKPVTLTLVPSDQEYASTHSFKLKVPDQAWLYIQVDDGLQGLGGFTLADKYVTVGRVPPYPRTIHIMQDGALLALSGERKLSIQSRGVEQLEFQLQRVTSGSINHLVSQSEGNFQSPVFNNDNFDESNICEHLVRRQAIAASDSSKNDFSALDFSEFVRGGDGNKGKLGLFILRVLGREEGPDGEYYLQNGATATVSPTSSSPTGNVNQNEASDSDDVPRWRANDNREPVDRPDLLADRRLVLITDLGLLVKDNADGTHDVFVQSIKTGQPVGGAQVQVLGKNGLPVATNQTDDDGHAAIPSLRDFAREKKPVAYVVRLDQDVSFLPFGREDRKLNLSRFDISGVSGLAPHDLTAFVFTDRGIYRPGDEAKLGLIVKQRDWQGKLDGIPVRLDITDPRGNQVMSRILKLNADGLLEVNFPTRETSPTGTYEVNCYLAKSDDEGTLLGSTSLRVAEFLPDRLKIKTTITGGTTEGWLSPSGLQGVVSLQNLYGTPSVDHRVRGKLVLNPSQFHFSRYDDYQFTDPHAGNSGRKVQTLELPEQTTNDSGEATFDLEPKDLDDSAYSLSFLTEGFEKEGGRSVTSGAGVLISPREWVLGYKTASNLDYIRLNDASLVHFLAVNRKLEPVAVAHLTMKLFDHHYISVLQQQPNGNYVYTSVLKESEIDKQDLSVTDKGLDWAVPTNRPGDFVARFYDDDHDLVTTIGYSVAGTANLTRSLDKDAELTVKLSKPEYLSGEDIEVEITAPYTGAGLLTIERDKVYAQAWFQAKTTTTVQKIHIPKDFEGNGYLNVAFVRGLDSREIYMSPLSYAVVPFKVNQEARHTHITIDVPKVARPGESLAIKVSTSRPTRAVVYAVDEGILQVSRYSLPDPLGYFFRKQALDVATRQTVDLILPEYSIIKSVAAAGGDADDDALAHHLNPFKRKRDKPVAYWSGIVELGPEAKTFTYDVPDYFAGTLRVMVVADTPDAVGSDQKTLQVCGPFVISPNVPTFVAPGDTFEVTSAVANNIEGSGPNATVNVRLDVSDGLEILEKPNPDVSIAEGRDASLRWKLRARDQLGNADLTVVAESGAESGRMVSHLSIRPPVPYLTTLTTGYFKQSEKTVPVSRKVYPEFRKATALVSPLPQGLSRGLGEYLEHYEYGCTEQLISKAFPSLVSDEIMQQGLARLQVAEKLQQILSVAASRQNDEGAFGLWMTTPNLHFDLPSIHVMHFMTEARDEGYNVPDDMMKRGLSHLQRDAEANPANFRQARNQAYAIYVLARNGIVVTNALEHNRDWFARNAPDNWSDDLAAVYEAATYALLKNQDQANALIGNFHLRDPKHCWPMSEVDYDNDMGRAAQYILLLSRHFPDRARKLSPDDLEALTFPIIQEDYNTISSAEAIWALNTYGRAMQAGFAADSVGIDEIIGQAKKPLSLSSGFYPTGTFDREASALLFHRAALGNAPRGVFYQISQSGFEQGPVTQPISQGLEVSREYRNQAGNAVTSAALGEELDVVIHVRTTDGQEINNIAVEDLLPGGFEIVDDSVHSGACSYGWGSMEYVDVREDRLLTFGTVGPQATTITYKIKATNRGTYVVPPAQAEAMYHLKIRARGVTGALTVQN